MLSQTRKDGLVIIAKKKFFDYYKNYKIGFSFLLRLNPGGTFS